MPEQRTDEPSFASAISEVLGAGIAPAVRRLIENRVQAERERCLYWMELWDACSSRWRDIPMDEWAIKQRIITNIKSGLEPE